MNAKTAAIRTLEDRLKRFGAEPIPGLDKMTMRQIDALDDALSAAWSAGARAEREHWTKLNKKP